MKFDCKEISINNDDFGCNVSLNDREEDTRDNLTFDEILDSLGEYVMLQRSYPEDEFENEFRFIETHNPDIDGELKNFKIELSKTKVLITYCDKRIEIIINSTTKDYNNLKEALKTIAYKKGELIIKE